MEILLYINILKCRTKWLFVSIIVGVLCLRAESNSGEAINLKILILLLSYKGKNDRI